MGGGRGPGQTRTSLRRPQPAAFSDPHLRREPTAVGFDGAEEQRPTCTAEVAVMPQAVTMVPRPQ